MTNPSQELATSRQGPAQMIEQYRGDFAQVLPSHIKPDTWVRLASGLMRRNPDLADAAAKNPPSLMQALLDCARLGHEPGTDQYALTVFNNNRTGVPEIVGIEQYQGEIERMYRAGAVTSVRVEVVRQNDHFRWSPTIMRLPEHDFDALAGDAERGPLRGVYTYAHMQHGALSQVIVMNKDEVMRHKAVARSKKFWEGPWEPSMWKKTAVHELEKFVPTSSEYMREQLRAVRDVAAEPARPLAPVPPLPADEPHVDVITGVVEDDVPGPAA